MSDASGGQELPKNICFLSSLRLRYFFLHVLLARKLAANAQLWRIKQSPFFLSIILPGSLVNNTEQPYTIWRYFLFCNCARLRKGKNQTLWSSNCFSLIRVGNLPFRSSLFCSKSLILKSDCERLALLALYKRATMSKLLSLLFTKEQPWVNRSSRSLQKSYC